MTTEEKLEPWYLDDELVNKLLANAKQFIELLEKRRKRIPLVRHMELCDYCKENKTTKIIEWRITSFGIPYTTPIRYYYCGCSTLNLKDTPLDHYRIIK